jgi:hypothetical protein
VSEDEKFESVVQRAGPHGNEFFTEEALRSQDGKVVPLRIDFKGPVIGEATLKYDEEDKALKAEFRVDDPDLAEFLKGSPPNLFS